MPNVSGRLVRGMSGPLWKIEEQSMERLLPLLRRVGYRPDAQRRPPADEREVLRERVEAAREAQRQLWWQGFWSPFRSIPGATSSIAVYQAVRDWQD